MTVYPRWRGEHGLSSMTLKAGGGLSPLARGTRGNSQTQCDIRRFIPAGAGNTGISNGAHTICSVYPRWRGEHEIHNQMWIGSFGLSPLARGTLLNPQRDSRNGRFIPAGAGNTLNIYNCFLLQFSSSNNLPTWEQQFRFIKEHSTY